MEHARKKKDYLHVELPESAVIYLRHTKNTPDKLTVEVSAPNGQKMTYESKVIKVQNYTKSVIFRKKLLLFLPFYVMRYEEELETLDKDAKRLEALIKEYLDIYSKMEKVLEENGASELYGDLLGYILENLLKYILVKARFGEGTGMIIYLRKKTPARTRIEQIINVSMKT